MRLEVLVPNEHLGDVMVDLSKRRGRIQSQEDLNHPDAANEGAKVGAHANGELRPRLRHRLRRQMYTGDVCAMSNVNAAPPNPRHKQEPRNPTSRLVSAKDAAAETGIPYTSLRDLVFRGEISVLKVGKGWYCEHRDLENWISSRKERLS